MGINWGPYCEIVGLIGGGGGTGEGPLGVLGDPQGSLHTTWAHLVGLFLLLGCPLGVSSHHLGSPCGPLPTPWGSFRCLFTPLGLTLWASSDTEGRYLRSLWVSCATEVVLSESSFAFLIGFRVFVLYVFAFLIGFRVKLWPWAHLVGFFRHRGSLSNVPVDLFRHRGGPLGIKLCFSDRV